MLSLYKIGNSSQSQQNKSFKHLQILINFLNVYENTIRKNVFDNLILSLKLFQQFLFISFAIQSKNKLTENKT